MSAKSANTSPLAFEPLTAYNCNGEAAPVKTNLLIFLISSRPAAPTRGGLSLAASGLRPPEGSAQS